MDFRALLLRLGVAAALVGLGLALLPGLARPVSASEALVLGIALVALLVGANRAIDRHGRAVKGAETGDPEIRRPMPAPGDDLDWDLADVRRFRGTAARQRVRERLHGAAVAVVRRRYDCTPEEAEAMIERGDWTDDPHAAAFLGGKAVPPPPRRGLSLLLSIESRFRFRAHRTIETIARLAGMEDEG